MDTFAVTILSKASLPPAQSLSLHECAFLVLPPQTQAHFYSTPARKQSFNIRIEAGTFNGLKSKLIKIGLDNFVKAKYEQKTIQALISSIENNQAIEHDILRHSLLYVFL